MAGSKLLGVTERRALAPLRGEANGPRYYAKASHRTAVPDGTVDRASDAEVLALLRAAYLAVKHCDWRVASGGPAT
ncbi:hypothetical protein GCM10009753_52600 [Streptantibioticus ferralitis]